MASDLLVEFLARQPNLRWELAPVTSLQTGSITVSMVGADVPGVYVLSSYVPKVGDVAACLIYGPIGILAIGSIIPRATTNPPVSGYTTVNPTGYATWTVPTTVDPGFWTITGQDVTQADGKVGAFFYNKADFSVLSGKTLATAEIQVMADRQTTPIFQIHGNADISTPYVALTNEYAYQEIPPITPTWITLPLVVGETMADPNIIAGIGLSANVYDIPDAIFNGYGSLRFTTL